MDKMHSNAEDCFALAKYLKKKMGSKIDFYGSVRQEVIRGKYFSHYRDPHSELDYLFEEGLPFYLKFCKNGFLRIEIGSLHNNSMGERLAALSSFYKVLSEQHGDPTVFYTIKDDDEKALSLQWSLANRVEDIQKFRNGSYFDDAEIDELIIIGESRTRTNCCNPGDATKSLIANQIGIPFDLITLVDENIEDFMKYKIGKEISVSEGAKVDGVPVISLKKKLEK